MEMICINCPMGCRMEVEVVGEEVLVNGNHCPRGKKYAQQECTCPTRVVTSSIYVQGGIWPVVPVKTAKAIPKDKVFKVLEALKYVQVAAPVSIGDVIIENVIETGIDVVATKENALEI